MNRVQMTEALAAADFQQIDGGPLLLAAYAVVWLIFFLAVVYVLLRLRKVTTDVNRIEAKLDAQGDVERKEAA